MENTYNTEQETLKDIYSSSFKSSLGTQLQWFQTRINHIILSTRTLLYIMKHVQSPNCTFCVEEETISHMLWTCPESQSIIRQVIRYVSDKILILHLWSIVHF